MLKRDCIHLKSDSLWCFNFLWVSRPTTFKIILVLANDQLLFSSLFFWYFLPSHNPSNMFTFNNIFPLNNHLSFHSLTLQQRNGHVDGGKVILPKTSLLPNKRRDCSHVSLKHKPSSTVHPFFSCMLLGYLSLVSNETVTNRSSFESFLGYLWCEWILWEKSRCAIQGSYRAHANKRKVSWIVR